MGGVVDFVFLVDGTGSMGPCMEALKSNLQVFLDELEGAQSPVHDWRGKVTVFRDHETDGSGWLDDNDFVSDGTSLRAQLAAIAPRGGGDEPESALDALHLIATMEQTDKSAQELDPQRWRYRSSAGRVVILFTDATFKSPMTYDGGSGGTVDDVCNAITNAKVVLCMFAPDDTGWEHVASVDRAEWEPVPEDPDFVSGLQNIVSDHAKFAKVMQALAKSVSKSAVVETL